MAKWFGGNVPGWNKSIDNGGYAYEHQKIKNLRVQVKEDGDLRASYNSKPLISGDIQDGSVVKPDASYFFIEDMTLKDFMEQAEKFYEKL